MTRETTQRLLPTAARGRREGYDVFPEFRAPGLRIGAGLAALVEALGPARAVAVDGSAAAHWTALRAELERAWSSLGVQVHATDTRDSMRSAAQIEHLVAPFLGGQDPLFGRRCDLELGAFFPEREPGAEAAGRARPGTVRLWCGPGAALLAPDDAVLVYVDVPKNEEQFRARAGSARNLGAAAPGPPRAMYKRAYFVDWPVLRRHAAALLERVAWYVDAQDPAGPTFLSGDELRAALERMSRAPFRPRPWFEPGPWGGRWLLSRVGEACAVEVPNLAWSFELIAPENGVVLSDGRLRCEVSLDRLLAARGREVLGFGHAFFGDEFPIRFDFLDTVEGGNLSVQVHPRPDTIRREFGERITQDEAYYILDATDGATVYLGLAEGADPAAFRVALQESERAGTALDVEAFVRRLPAAAHDFFLIPHGTVHGAGRGNLVLEISATPYIFTFKLYDWLRPGLDGRPRPLNVERGLANLDRARRGAAVERELLSRPRDAAQGPGWRREELPTHRDHFYAVARTTLDPGGEVAVPTGGSPHVLMVVEGRGADVRAAGGGPERFAYAETFVVPAAAGSYGLANSGGEPIRVLAAYLKPRGEWPRWMREAEDARG